MIFIIDKVELIDRGKLYDGLLGLAIGDSLGVPAEFINRGVLEQDPITDMVSGGIWKQPAGTWSDDTAMTLATIDALNNNNWQANEKLYEDIMDNFVAWYTEHKYAANGVRFDIGNTCRKAIENYILRGNVNNCGVQGKHYGNGALMRMLPMVFIGEKNITKKISALTHNNKICTLSSLIYVHMAKELINAQDKELAFINMVDYFSNYSTTKPFSRILNKKFKNTLKKDIKSSGYVVDTLEAAIWCFINTNNYEECVLTAVNLGDDTDTVAAIAGSLAGLYYGKNAIPTKWIKSLRDIDTLKQICFNNSEIEKEAVEDNFQQML